MIILLHNLILLDIALHQSCRGTQNHRGTWAALDTAFLHFSTYWSHKIMFESIIEDNKTGSQSNILGSISGLDNAALRFMSNVVHFTWFMWQEHWVYTVTQWIRAFVPSRGVSPALKVAFYFLINHHELIYVWRVTLREAVHDIACFLGI